MSSHNARLFFATFSACALLATSAWAVLPPEEQRKWHEAYLGQIDIQAEIEYSHIAFEPQFFQNPRCVTYYTVGRVIQHPDELNINSGDQLLLNYPCDNEGNWDWMGSTLPWAELRLDGSINAQLASPYLFPDGSRRWVLKNDPPIFAPVKPETAQKPSAEDVASPADINASDGIDRDEANVVAREFFHRNVSPCGRLGEPVEKDSRFEYSAFLGKKEKLYQHPVVIDRATGKVSMVEFSADLDFKNIESKPALEEIMNECETSGEEDDLSRERWLQREKDELIYCPVTDHYMLPLEREDYPTGMRILAPYQRYASCKYGNPATFFAVLTTDPAAAAEGCAHPLLAAARERRVSDVIMGPAAAVDNSKYDFKIASPTYAAYVIATVYDVEKLNYWVDRAYEFLRYAEASSVACNHLPGENSSATAEGEAQGVYSVRQFQALTLQPGIEYEVHGFLVDIVDCPPCPQDAVCATCPGEYIIISDSPHKTELDEARRAEKLWVSTMLKGLPEIKKWIKYRLVVHAHEHASPGWDKSPVSLISAEEYK